MQEKNPDSNKVKKKYHRYSADEKQNKYCYQSRWQKENSYIVKTYKLNGETIKDLLQFSEENDMPQAKVLCYAFQEFKKNTTLGQFWQSNGGIFKSNVKVAMEHLSSSEDKVLNKDVFLTPSTPSKETIDIELSKFLQSIAPSEDKKYGVKKNFKMFQDVALEIEGFCKQFKIPYGYFVTKILDDYMADQNKGQRN